MNLSLIKALENLAKENPLFSRIFEYRTLNLDLKNFENFSEFKNQELIFIKDKILQIEAIFNLSRRKRPMPQETLKENLKEYDPFCSYETSTPIDELGRLENTSAVTAANLSKMADYHSLVIFKKHNFENLNETDFKNALLLTKEYFERIKLLDNQIQTQILIWNYHYRSGASILHPHFQVLSYKEIPQKIKFWSEEFRKYKENYFSDYIEDYFQIAQKLGIVKELENLRIWFSLVPFKEKTLFFLGNLENFWPILKKLIDAGTQTFNLFYIFSSPLLENFGFFVDRGEINKLNSDFGALEIFGLPVVSYDPLELAQLIFS